MIASSLVQKSYSVNFPGEFGGGVINLTTKAIPQEQFLSRSAARSAAIPTPPTSWAIPITAAPSDWTGFDNGSRDMPPALAAYLEQRRTDQRPAPSIPRRSPASWSTRARRARPAEHQHSGQHLSFTLTGGTSFDVGSDDTLGIIANFGYSNKWRTRDVTQQTAASADLSQKEQRFRNASSPTTGSSSTACSASASNGMTTRSAGPISTSATRSSRPASASARASRHRRRDAATSRTPPGTNASCINTQVIGEFKLA